MAITVQGLTKKYGTQIAVNAISFSINEPGIVGFLGPNGAGKSTTMKMITGYLQPDAGQVQVCGHNLPQGALAAKSKLGYLPESNPLYHDLYVREYLELSGRWYNATPLKTRINDTIEQVGLGHEAHKKIGQLSKGYKQRVGLAAAILHSPEVMILDEPTSGLDPNQLTEIRTLIKTLGRQKTVLLSTHIMQEVEAMCDRVIIIHKGNLVADDSLANLRSSNKQKAIKVGFEEPLEPEWLKRLPGVTGVEKTESLHWMLHTNDTDALRKQVLLLAADQNLNIVSLQTTGGSMEEIFRSLTN
ncbi:MAG: gliding motility-associated ABC transporter ATP-binding subunit GldA [Chitinophagaceae bacterium]|nr:gliding motility-associated ABC transporter ATP-binding subunit GldA [Chitinophagaceae bacterium]